ncbi:hypothetical protein CAPTEDRAFT_184923 [Capitella teleta]|uniref:Uncharacterized protein n=1 Tax=Capitella teleta TaxID=283909 RepID=R7T681_CAPTE|nr:hypothetical protein CAPTEDRAFT_184923 [Capitella teleta]|eukprot:ELT88758.1 hypothetical protein CAPTEDRAFT_184923 [Capitella teleta]
MDSNDHDQSDEDDATSVDFDSLNSFPDPKDPHLHPIWFSDPQKSDIHLIEAEVDSGAGCNTFSLYVYRRIFGAAPMDRPSVIIKAYRDQPVRNLGSKLLMLHIGKRILQYRFQICDVRKNPIIGRQASEEMGYITFPPVKQPILLSKPIVQEEYTIITKMQATEKINAKKQSPQHRAQDHQASMDHYNRHAKERDELQELQRVWFKKEPTANWKPATVMLLDYLKVSTFR